MVTRNIAQEYYRYRTIAYLNKDVLAKLVEFMVADPPAGLDTRAKLLAVLDEAVSDISTDHRMQHSLLTQ
jgi:hypothetical protein